MPLFKHLAATALFCLVCSALFAQQPAQQPATPPAPISGTPRTTLLTSAMARYYNLRSAGVKSFSCAVDIDWQSLFIALAGAPLPEDDPRMKYFRASHLSFVETLNAEAATVTWAPGPQPPAENGDKAVQLRESYSQMVSGFFEAWLPSLNGTLISPSSTGTLIPTSSGYLFKESGDSDDVSDIVMDKNLLIQHLSTKSDALHSEMDTTFAPTAGGLVLTSMDTQYSQPASAPPTHIIMSATFAPVAGFQLPATLLVNMPNVVTFKMAFTGCTVQK